MALLISTIAGRVVRRACLIRCLGTESLLVRLLRIRTQVAVVALLITAVACRMIRLRLALAEALLAYASLALEALSLRLKALRRTERRALRIGAQVAVMSCLVSTVVGFVERLRAAKLLILLLVLERKCCLALISKCVLELVLLLTVLRLYESGRLKLLALCIAHLISGHAAAWLLGIRTKVCIVALLVTAVVSFVKRLVIHAYDLLSDIRSCFLCSAISSSTY
ncbi:hypothetical protein [Paenibacillus senegalensis]|uniref:hypothetical protein n=1 Tax=Paenibacillus senegalensis TaxID=1465766 RepID=UPI0012FB37A4|nr:hypothetical protein [Paenibacillus senegalensis]